MRRREANTSYIPEVKKAMPQESGADVTCLDKTNTHLLFVVVVLCWFFACFPYHSIHLQNYNVRLSI